MRITTFLHTYFFVWKREKISLILWENKTFFFSRMLSRIFCLARNFVEKKKCLKICFLMFHPIPIIRCSDIPLCVNPQCLTRPLNQSVDHILLLADDCGHITNQKIINSYNSLEGLMRLSCLST